MTGPIGSTPQRWRLRGFDTFDGEYYDLDGAYPSEADAQTAAAARLRELEARQPAASSGGQGGVQDRVFVVRPDGTQYRVCGGAW